VIPDSPLPREAGAPVPPGVRQRPVNRSLAWECGSLAEANTLAGFNPEHDSGVLARVKYAIADIEK
jgi:hypothetical protein